MSTSDSCKDGASKTIDDGVCDVNDTLQNIRLDNDNVSVCANCGKGEEESHKLKSCTACKLVKYCNRECQIAHRPQHEKECRKRAAEIHDIELFKQRPLQENDCPICFQQLPTLVTGWRYYVCCGKVICSGCVHAPVYDDQGNVVNNRKCPFCRIPHPDTEEEYVKRLKKRVETGDPIATYNLGVCYRDGTFGYSQDHTKALELWHCAVELDNAEAYNSIGYSYEIGRGVEVDEKKATYYYELSAMKGNEVARCNLGCMEMDAGNIGRAIKHFMIAVRDGHTASLKEVKQLYTNGHASKEDYTKALKLYQAYLSEIKSVQRDEAAAASERYRYY